MLESNTPKPFKINNHKEHTYLLPPQGMSRARDILPLLPFSRTTLHEWSLDGRFPASVRLSPSMVAWRNSDVLEWIENHSNPANNTQENTNE